MSISPKPLMPGVSITAPPSASGYIVEKVVVCRPLWWLSEISPVRMSSEGSMARMSVDFPTPELPETRVVRPLSSSCTAPTPSPVAEETSMTRYPALSYTA